MVIQCCICNVRQAATTKQNDLIYEKKLKPKKSSKVYFICSICLAIMKESVKDIES